jgi:hypothetical protein
MQNVNKQLGNGSIIQMVKEHLNRDRSTVEYV